jgi:negative regulator of sigma E activity
VKKVFNKPNIPMRCRKFEARFEDYLGGAPDSELNDHLTRCEDCRSAMEDSRLAGNLLREAWEPASEPSQAFLANVMARIHQEEVRAKSPAAFWAPLEFLASRLSLTAAVVLLALSVYLVEFAPHQNASLGPIRTELSASDFPQPPGDPVSNEEVLQSLLERNNGR